MPGSRLASLRAAALLAVAFVVLRVVYRVLFGGGSGGGAVLLDLPRIRLGGPFEYITLLGPITSGGLTAVVMGALPFVAVILAFGLLAALIDVRRLLTRGSLRGPLRTVARAMVVAWAALPALRDSVQRVRTARELRGERSAPALLVPVFEHTIERALALAASMEVRGFAAATRHEPRCEQPVVMRDAALGFAGQRILAGIDLALEPGTLTLVTGPTGSGKSSLIHAMSGLFQHFMEGEQTGLIEIGGVDRRPVPPRETAGFVGVVPQAVRLSFVAETVAEEIGFALAVRGVAPVIVRDRVAEIAGHLGVSHLLERSIHALSAGEACLVAIGAALVSHPVLLLVDEPLADLDAEARARVVAVLGRLAHEAGVCVVVAEHSTAEWDPAADARLELRDGTVARAEVRAAAPATAFPLASRSVAVGRGPSLARIHDISVHHGAMIAVDGVSLDLAAGEVVALTGPNGAGKSSLLHAIAKPSTRDRVVIAGSDAAGLPPRARRAAVALVPEEFDDLFFSTTVAEECRRADRRSTGPGGRTRETFAGFLRRSGADADLMARHPRDLSAGERLCLALAIQLSARPSLLLVDEPTRGLDPAARELVGDALAQVAAAGSAVLVATHDLPFVARYAQHAVSMAGGRLVIQPERIAS
ncbi:hypothetical protein BH11ACT4_BH11ACT4_25510 [soil metagenome]